MRLGLGPPQALALLTLAFAGAACGRTTSTGADSPASLLDIVRAYDELERLVTWSGYRPGSTPLMLFTGADTVLVRCPAELEGFEPHAVYSAAWGEPVSWMAGRHEEASSTHAVELEGTLLAVFVFDDRLSTEELARGLLHEAFHVHHLGAFPSWSWRVEESSLLFPPDDLEQLALRRFETECLRRAVDASLDSRANEAVLAWGAAACAWRAERELALGRPDYSAYEWTKERSEGLAQWIQHSTGAAAPRNPIAPAGYPPDFSLQRIYDVGEAWVRVLERAVPDWQARLRAQPDPRLDEILAEHAAAFGVEAEHLGAADMAALRAQAERDLELRRDERDELLAELDREPGWRLDVRMQPGASFDALGDPHLAVTLGPHQYLHRAPLRLVQDSAYVLVDGPRARTWQRPGSPPWRAVERILIGGLEVEPAVDAREDGSLRAHAAGVEVACLSATSRVEGRTVVIEVAPESE